MGKGTISGEIRYARHRFSAWDELAKKSTRKCVVLLRKLSLRHVQYGGKPWYEAID